jgi:hypothetical protein
MDLEKQVENVKNLLVLLTLLAPLTATASQDTGNAVYDYCISIIPKIIHSTKSVTLKSLELVPAGYNVSNVNGSPSVNCTYTGVTQDTQYYAEPGHADYNTVAIFAALNLTSKKLIVEVI